MCRCGEYGDLEFERKAISRRIRETPALKKTLEAVATHPSGHTLYRCPECQQLWQCSRAWNWGNKDYLFKVPSIAASDWSIEPYVHPSDLFEFGHALGSFLEGSPFSESEKGCAVPSCPSRAVKGAVYCLRHHVESLQRAKQLPANPVGRWFGPYVRERCVPAL